MPALTGGPDGLREIEDELDVALDFQDPDHLRALGWRLHTLVGSTGAMWDVLRRVSGRNEALFERRVGRAERAWDGIEESGRDQWMW